MADSVDSEGQVVIKRNPVPQPNHHWGDGLEKDVMSYADLRMPLNEGATTNLYGHGGYSFRKGTGNGYRRYAEGSRNWPQIFPVGYLPEFEPDVTDYSAAGGLMLSPGGWKVDAGGSYGHNDFKYNLRNTLKVSLGPCLERPAPWARDSLPNTGDDRAFQPALLLRGQVKPRDDLAVSASSSEFQAPRGNWTGASYRQRLQIGRGVSRRGATAATPTQFGAEESLGRRCSPVTPSDEGGPSATTRGLPGSERNLKPSSRQVAGAREYSDFGSWVTGKRRCVTALRAAHTQGRRQNRFRARDWGRSLSKVVTNFIQAMQRRSCLSAIPRRPSAARSRSRKNVAQPERGLAFPTRQR